MTVVLVLGSLTLIGIVIYAIYKFNEYLSEEYYCDFFTFRQIAMFIAMMIAVCLTLVSFNEGGFNQDMILNLVATLVLILYQYIYFLKQTNWYIALGIIIAQLATMIILVGIIFLLSGGRSRRYYYD